MATLEEIRAKLLAQAEKSENRSSGSSGDGAMFPFWNTPEDKTTTIRFLPDNDPDNMFFWKERLVIRLPFQGVVGEHDKEVTVQVPCMEMYNKTCPILSETRPWWKDDALVDLARRYWKKKSYIFQGFVVDTPVKEDNAPENPIRRFTINTSIFNKIKSSLMDAEMEDLPIDYDAGRDFKITKTQKGQYASYETSNWSFKSRSLSQEERDAIDQYGLFTLGDYLPKEPSAEELEVIKEMFKASVDDQPYDPAKWGNYYRPFGVNAPGAKTESKTETKFAPKKATKVEVEEDVVEEKVEETPKKGKQDPSEILARIRAKNKA